MKILILGGTQFLGRFMVETALRNGHEVTLFNRGKTNPSLFPDVEKIHGDRKRDMDLLLGRSWDAVIDTSGYTPREVSASTKALAEAVKHYTFISTISVYADLKSNRIHEGSTVQILQSASEDVTGESYGGLKVLCEQVVERAYPNQNLIVRAGLIVGPYDPTYHFNYWLHTLTQGDETLAPSDPNMPFQFIDVRDLANWTLHMVESRQTGIYNATGPEEPLPFGTFLEEARAMINPKTRLTWVSEDFLLQQKVEPFLELPFWIPSENWGIYRIDVSRARATGLSYRPLAETLMDTLPFAQQMAAQIDPLQMSYGITNEREHELLALWHHALK